MRKADEGKGEMSKGKVLITGISGFIAGHIAKQALEAGYAVRGSVRSLKRVDEVRETLSKAGADVSALEFCALDLMKDDGWNEAMAGIDVLCHCASPFIGEIPKDPDELIRPAVEGTERAVSAALKAGVRKIALTSSFAAVGYGETVKSSAYTADDWSAPGGRGMTPYIESKYRAELRAWEMVNGAGAREKLTVINPVLVLGPTLNNDLSTSVGLIRRLLKGEFPLAPDFSFPVVDVRDIAALHVRAFENDLGGQRIIGGEDTISILEMAAILREIAPNARMPKAIAPKFLLRIMALFDSGVAGIIDDIGVTKTVERAPAEAVLGRKLITAREAILESGKALQAEGAV